MHFLYAVCAAAAIAWQLKVTPCFFNSIKQQKSLLTQLTEEKLPLHGVTVIFNHKQASYLRFLSLNQDL